MNTSGVRQESAVWQAESDLGEVQTSRRGDRFVTVATFVGLLAVVEIGLLLVEPKLPPPLDWPSYDMQAKYEEIVAVTQSDQDIDIAFVGSSVVFDGIDPRSFRDATPSGVTVYNAGVAGGVSTQAWRWWTTEVVVPQLDPEIVVIGMTSLDLNNNDPDSFWPRLTRSRGYGRVVAQTGGGILTDLEETLEERVGLFRLRTVLRDPVRLLLDFGDEPDEVLTIGPMGAPPEREIEPYRLTPERARRLRERELRDFELKGPRQDHLRGLLQDLKSQGVTVVLVNMPVTEDYLELHPRGESDYNEYRETLAGLARGEEVELLDFGRHLNSVEFFRDETHLNLNGAVVFSRTLAEKMASG